MWCIRLDDQATSGLISKFQQRNNNGRAKFVFKQIRTLASRQAEFSVPSFEAEFSLHDMVEKTGVNVEHARVYVDVPSLPLFLLNNNFQFLSSL